MQKTTFKTRLLALLTAAFMIVMCVPFAAFADGGKVQVVFKQGANITSMNAANQSTNVPFGFSINLNEVLAPQVAEGCTLQYVINVEKDPTATSKTLTVDEASNVTFDEATYGGASMVTVEAQGVAPVAPSKVKVMVQADVNKGTMAGAPDGVVSQDVPVEYLGSFGVPAVTAKEGYVFAGWHVDAQIGEASELKSKDYGAETTNIDLSEFTGASRILISAVFNEATVAPSKVKVMVQADVNKGTMAGVPDGVVSQDVPVEYLGSFGVPAVTAKEGYVFAGWHVDAQIGETSELKSKDYGAETTTIDLSEFTGASRILISAVFEAEAANGKVIFVLQYDANKGKIDGVKAEGESTEVPADAKFELPVSKVSANDGFYFNGWTVVAQFADKTTKTVTLAKDAATVNMADYKGAKYVGVMPIFAEQYNGNVTFVLQYDKTKGKIDGVKAEGESTTVPNDAKFELPTAKVSANDGYKFAGWTVLVQYADQSNKTFTLGADAKFVNMADYKYAKYVGVMPVFEKEQKTESTSASTSSSSSNTTITAASQQQVVKAAAAPANTTKVLPKTGATNAAPLIGGSLAVVALLMGYGVYGLVLRKKD